MLMSDNIALFKDRFFFSVCPCTPEKLEDVRVALLASKSEPVVANRKGHKVYVYTAGTTELIAVYNNVKDFLAYTGMAKSQFQLLCRFGKVYKKLNIEVSKTPKH